VIACDAARHPLPAMHPDTRAGLIDAARRLDPMVLHWSE
jgi:4-hydroxy-tetrahydrodipicolinate synthase/2-keto-3-deoxy-L-arabinonate dehydratase